MLRPLLPLLVLVLLCLLPSLTSAQSTSYLPTITSVSGCTDVGTSTYNCSETGETLTISGVNFLVNPDAAPSAGIVFGGQHHAVCWPNLPFTNTTLTCAAVFGPVRVRC